MRYSPPNIAGTDLASRSALIPFPAMPNMPRSVCPVARICRMVEL